MTTRANGDDEREDIVSADTAIDVRGGPRTGYAPTVTPDSVAPVDNALVPLDDETFAQRYATSDLLGEGGMGEVRLAHDARIGREVAMKVVRGGQGSRSDMRSRFLREARVQGQLEHPAIVPVYDLGARPDGAAFFTMKRVRGKTLEEILDDLRAKEPGVETEFSRRKLLTAFASVCLAIDFAHARSVIHRDLKPGNIMLGGFGEVYVLDWGLAKISGDGVPQSGKDAEVVDAPSSIRGQTEAGAVMGTPGYMAPEQLVTTEVDARADVYALGAILFEIITLRPLHNKPKLAQVLDSTLTGPEARASVICPDLDVPPELEAIWTRAIALKKEDRFESARELNDHLERFLDGDRDLEQRKKMAQDHVERGAGAAARAMDQQSASERKSAMQELGRALALDPSNPQAIRVMVELMAAPPTDLPAEAKEEIARAEDRGLRMTGRVAFVSFGAWFLFVPVVLIAGCKEPWLLAAIGGTLLAATVASWLVSRQERPSNVARWVASGSSLFSIALSTRFFGPFMLVPALALSNAMGVAITHGKRDRFFACALATSALVVPFALELLGVLSPSYVFENGRLVIIPHLMSFEHTGLISALMVATNVTILIAGVTAVGAVRDHLARFERHTRLQAWHFRQLAPDEARAPSPAASPKEDAIGACLVDDLQALHDRVHKKKLASR